MGACSSKSSYRILLLGNDSSGKTTFCKQAVDAFLGGFQVGLRAQFVKHIQANVSDRESTVQRGAFFIKVATAERAFLTHTFRAQLVHRLIALKADSKVTKGVESDPELLVSARGRRSDLNPNRAQFPDLPCCPPSIAHAHACLRACVGILFSPSPLTHLPQRLPSNRNTSTCSSLL